MKRAVTKIGEAETRLPRHLASLLVASLGFAFACGMTSGGSGDQLANGGIGGTGVSEGPITSFGSIFVNGIEWFIGDSTIEIDRNSGSESDLRIGMVVRVEGTIDKKKGTGEASRVYFDNEVEGPVESIDPVGSEGLIKELRVLGMRVWIEAGRTRFDDEDPASDFGFDTIATGDVVEVSGLVDADGVIRATHLEYEGDVDLGSTRVDLRGTISGFAGGSSDSFAIGSIGVTFDPTGVQTDLSELPGGVANGVGVAVRGVITAADAVRAERIELAERFDDADLEDYSVTGFVGDFVDLSSFTVAGHPVDASGAAFENGNASMIENGVFVEVEGDLEGGVLIADEVDFEDRQVEISAAIASAADIDVQHDRVFLLGVEIQRIPSTRLEDDRSGVDPLGLADLQPGDYLAVKGASTGSGGVVASEIRRASVGDIELEGPVDAFDAATGEIVVLGVSVATNPSTQFRLDGDSSSSGDFFAALEVGDFVDVADADDGDATRIDVADEVARRDEGGEDDD